MAKCKKCDGYYQPEGGPMGWGGKYCECNGVVLNQHDVRKLLDWLEIHGDQDLTDAQVRDILAKDNNGKEHDGSI